MKKASFYILILILFINLITPFTISVDTYTGIHIQKNIVSADNYQDKLKAFQDSITVARRAAANLSNYVKLHGTATNEVEQAFKDAVSKSDQAAKDLGAAALTEDQKKEVAEIIKSGYAAIQKALDNPSSVVDINAKNDSTNDTSTYTLLAPIGTLTEVKTGSGFGDYLNIIFKIGIGLCGALAVIMIVIGGVQYMGDESVFGKTEAKGRIFSAILGLLIALGAYAILYTINPDLTGQNGVTVDQVVAEIDEEPILSDASTPVPIGATNKFANCPGGVRKVQTKVDDFIACAAFAINLQRLVADAYNSTPSIVIGGGGFRTYESQVAIYKRNCSGKPKCNPPTAVPGTSMHESGLAFDFKCDGKLINFDGQQKRFPINPSTKKCFDWLSANASKYGLVNFPKENWHWSTNGH